MSTAVSIFIDVCFLFAFIHLNARISDLEDTRVKRSAWKD